MCKFLHGHIFSFLLGRYLELGIPGCVCAKPLQSCPTLCAPWTVACQAPLSMGCSRQEYRSGLPCPPPGDLSDPGIESVSLISPALAGRFFTTSATWEAPSLPCVGLYFSVTNHITLCVCACVCVCVCVCVCIFLPFACHPGGKLSAS